MRPEPAKHRLPQRSELISAVLGARLRQHSALDDVREKSGVRPIAHTHEIVVALLRRAMVAGKRSQWHEDVGVLFVLFYEGVVGVGGTANQAARSVLAQVQHEIGCYLIGGVFLAAKQRDLVYLEKCVADLVCRQTEQLTDYCMLTGNSIRWRFQGRGLPDAVFVFVADARGASGLFLI